MSVTKRIRYEVLRRDGNRCRYCGRTVEDGARLTVDHVIPTALGGTDDPSNLVAACSDCNAGKAATSPSDALAQQVSDDAFRWARAMQLAAEQADREASAFAHAVSLFDEGWNNWTSNGRTVPRPPNWEGSIRAWLAAGLRIEDLCDLIPSAMRNGLLLENRWRYYCGCAWGLLKKRQEAATAILQGESS